MKNNLSVVTSFLNDKGLGYSVFHNDAVGIGEVAVPECDLMIGVIEEGNPNLDAGLALYTLSRDEEIEASEPEGSDITALLTTLVATRQPGAVAVQ